MFTELAVNLLWEQYGKSFLNKIADTGQQNGENSIGQKQKKLINNHYLNDYGKVKLFGKRDSVALGEIFTDVYIHSEISAMQRFNVDELHEEPEKHNRLERHNGFELLQEGKFPRWFILGKPGSGKTTFLKYITLQAVNGKIDKVPMFISLHVWANFLHQHQQQNFDLMPFLEEQFRICQFPNATLFINYLLSNGKALLLFDGLDEVNQADNERSNMMFALREFSREYRKCTILLTCRVAAADYSFNEQFKYLEVADFTAKQIDEFVRKWFGKNEERAEYFLQEFNEPEKHKNLRDLGKVPILLSLLCVIYERKMEFPTQRADIYEEAIEALLETWDRRYRSIRRDEIYKDLSNGVKCNYSHELQQDDFAEKSVFFKKI
jgi:predicted NACHT family NTPase